MENTRDRKDFQFLPKGGEMGELIRTHDWTKTSLGSIDTWEISLRTTLGTVLNSAFPMFLFWGEELLCFYNDAYRPSLGIDGKHPAIGKKAEDVWSDIWDFISPLIRQVMTTAKPVSFQDQLVGFYRNGRMEDIYWTFCYSAAFDDGGKINGILVTCTETTETVLTKRKLEESERRLRSMIGQAPVSIGIFQGKDYITEIANAKALEMWGRTSEEVLNKPILEAMPELQSQGIKELLDEVYTTNKIFRAGELPVQLRRNGKLENTYINFSYEPLYNADGEIDGIMTVGVEVTDQVITRKKIEESERKFRLLADSMPQHIWIADPQGNINYFNQSVYDYSGMSKEQVATEGWLQIVHPEDRENNIREWTKSISTGTDFLLEHRFRKHDGTYRWQLSRAKPQWDEDGNIQMWVGTSTDIQEHKNFANELEKQVRTRTAELVQLYESLKKSEERYHLMVAEVQDYAIIYLNRAGIVENWNIGAQKIKGYAAHEIIGRSFSNFYTEEDQNSGLHLSLLNMALKTGKASQEGWRVKKDGSLFWASVVITAVHNDKREVIGFSKVTHDLTDKKEASDALNAKTIELEEKNSELQRMNKELQSFAYISSHDLQEPLRKIQTFASRIVEKEYENLSDKGRELFNRMQRSAEQMQALINDLLAYSRTNTAEHIYQKVNLGSVVDKIKQDLQEELEEKRAQITVENPVEVNVIDFQFQQLFYNLISNSIKFSHPDRPLRIGIITNKLSGESLSTRNLPRDRDYWHIAVSDNGIGFESEYSERIFELFQRLHGKSEFKGTGIGLSIVKKIAENHNGMITATGEAGQGATFDIYLPVERQLPTENKLRPVG
ncbi:PAS domain-containing sensor histidine kinase [Algoriphagus terrigena]|uniref:PAS domain-containing sensor histidine kinase n=1 Tax=Algoriphagus terrigena TaxID=344884 RepID=UPI000409E420|nr:PAS domain S-box protein [Algoriphagus terrigena]